MSRIMSSVFYSLLTLTVTATAYAGLLDWPTHRQNQDRTGRSFGTGEITEPTIIDSIAVGAPLGKYSFLAIRTNEVEERYAFIEGGHVVLRNSKNQIYWRTGQLNVRYLISSEDFDGDGQEEILAISYGPPGRLFLISKDTGDILWSSGELLAPGSLLPPHQIVSGDIDDDGTPEIVVSPWKDAVVYVFSFGRDYQGVFTDSILWTYVKKEYNGRINPIIADVDNDSQQEIIFAERRKLTILDGQTGLEKYAFSTAFNSYSWGTLQAINVDSDPQLEILAIGNSHHNNSIAVFDVQDMDIQWQYQWEPNIHKARDISNPLVDLNNDGNLEVVISIYNDTDMEQTINSSDIADHDGVNLPNRWVTLVFDAATGALITHLPDTQIVGAVSGQPALLIVKSDLDESVSVPDFGTLKVFKYEDNKVIKTEEFSSASIVQLRNLPSPEFNDSGRYTTTGSLDINLNGVPEIFIIDDVDHDGIWNQIAAYEPTTDSGLHLVSTYSVTGTGINCIWNNEGRLPVYNGNGNFLIMDETNETHASFLVAGDPSTPLSLEMSEIEGNEILVRKPSGELLWYNQGTLGYVGRNNTPIITSGDIDGNGSMEIITGEILDPNIYRVSVVNPVTSTTLWSKDFHNFSTSIGKVVLANILGDTSGNDIVLHLQDDTQPSDTNLRLIALNRHNGSVIWDIPLSQNYRINPDLFVIDINHDDYDDILAIDTATMIYVDGQTAAQTDVSYSAWAYSGVVGDFNGDSVDEILYVNYAVDDGTALVPMLGTEPIWNVPHNYLYELYRHRLAVFTDDPGLGYVETTAHGSLTAIDMFGDNHTEEFFLKNGELNFVDVGGNEVSSPVVADINGDGHEDAIVGTADGYLMAIDLETQSLIWSLDVATKVLEPIVADIDGDNKLEIIVATSDANIKIVDQFSLQPVTEVRDVALDSAGRIVSPSQDIDITTNRVAYGVAWDKVDYATHYTVTIVDEYNGQIVTPVITSENTIVLDTAPRLYNRTYRAVVTAHGANNQTSTSRYSDGLVVKDDSSPEIIRLRLHPCALNQGHGKIDVTVKAVDNSWLDYAVLEIVDREGRVVYSEQAWLFGSEDEYTFEYFGQGAEERKHYFAKMSIYDAIGLVDVEKKKFRVANLAN